MHHLRTGTMLVALWAVVGLAILGIGTLMR